MHGLLDLFIFHLIFLFESAPRTASISLAAGVSVGRAKAPRLFAPRCEEDDDDAGGENKP